MELEVYFSRISRVRATIRFIASCQEAGCNFPPRRIRGVANRSGLLFATTYTNDFVIRDGYIESATIGAEHTAGLDPAFGRGSDALIISLGPIVCAEIGSTLAPDIADAVATLKDVKRF